jgi:hypothetical protein
MASTLKDPCKCSECDREVCNLIFYKHSLIAVTEDEMAGALIAEKRMSGRWSHHSAVSSLFIRSMDNQAIEQPVLVEMNNA